MKKLLLVLVFLNTSNGFSQIELRRNPYINSSIVLKKGDTLKGVVKLNGSAFDIRFKDSIKEKKSKKIKFKEVEKIIAYSKSQYPREFYYKKTDQSKFFHFVELVHNDTINVYITSTDRLGLFYSDSGVDRRSANEMMNDMRKPVSIKPIENILSIKKEINFFNSYLGLMNNFTVQLNIDRIDYFLHKKNQKKLVLIGVKGNFLYKNFKKTASKYFEDCPNLVEKIQSRELKLKHLPDIIEYYKTQCDSKVNQE